VCAITACTLHASTLQLFDKLGLESSSNAQSFVDMLYNHALKNVDQQAALAALAHALIVHPKTPEVNYTGGDLLVSVHALPL